MFNFLLRQSFFFQFLFYLFIYLFIYGCVGSSFLCKGFLQLRQVCATLHRGARASHYRGLSCCGVQAPDVQAQQLWLTGLVAPRHVGSSQTGARTRVPCIGRQTLNHWATREDLDNLFNMVSYSIFYLLDIDAVTVVVIALGHFILKSSAQTNEVFIWDIEKLRLSKGRFQYWSDYLRLRCITVIESFIIKLLFFFFFSSIDFDFQVY